MTQAPPTPPTRCLITGASGFIGLRLSQRLAERNDFALVATARNPQGQKALQAMGVQVVAADLLQPKQLATALVGCDAVVHLAHGHRGAEVTRNLVHAAKAAGVRRFVHISTMSVHGPAPGPEAASEDTAQIGRYQQDYCDSKAEQEEIVQAAMNRGDFEGVILRPTVVYGPHSHFVMQVAEQAQQSLVTWVDEGIGICNAVYIDDVCDAITAALISQAAVGQAMFINGDTPVTWRDFIGAFSQSQPTQPKYQNIPSAPALAYWAAQKPPEPKSMLARIWTKLLKTAGLAPVTPPAPWPALGRIQRELIQIHFSNAKAKRLLAWTPRVSFEHGAQLTQDWLKEECSTR